MMLQLRDRGFVHTDELLTDLLPEFSIHDPFGVDPGARLDLLASHMAGMPRGILAL